jgi:hypothetical protein
MCSFFFFVTVFLDSFPKALYLQQYTELSQTYHLLWEFKET